MLQVMLLGPPRVECDAALVSFDTRKALALLAHLAVVNRARPRDTLAELLWPDTDIEHARGALRRTLSSLRSAIGAEHVEATRDHVRLVRGPQVAVDVDRFRELRTARDLESAVEVFRGEFLEGFAVRGAPDFEGWAEAEAESLRRELTATLAELAGAREVAGDRTGALQLVRRWLDLDPLHEPAHRELIRLYAATGDRASALVQYRDCVGALSRELGVPPLAETTELYEAINRGSYDPPPPAVGPRTPLPAAARSIFVGRVDDLDAVRQAYDGIGADGRVVVIEGEAGIGKTRLAEQVLTRLRRLGAEVLVGRAYEDEAGLPYAPVVDVLRGRLDSGAGWLAGVNVHARMEAARLVPELAPGGPAGAVPVPVPVDGPGAEARFRAAVWDTLVAATAGAASGVLLVDDAQWADDATLDLLRYGLRRLAGRPLLLVLTWRTPYDHPLRRAATAVARTSGGTVRLLDRLGAESAAELVRVSVPGDHDPAAARRLWQRSEGVPLLLVEYLHTLGTLDDGELPDGVHDLLRARLDPVSETAHQILVAAAVLGRSFDVDTVRAVSGRTDEETVVALEELVRRGVVGEQQHGYDFAHGLLRTVVYDDTSLARRRLLHARAGDLLDGPAGAIARHLHLAGRDGEAATAYRDAGEQARLVFANGEALAHLRAALALGHRDRADLHADISELQTVLGDYAGALTSLEAAAAAAGPAELASVEHRLGRLRHRRGEYALAEAHLRAALAAAGDDTALQAAVTADLSLTVHSLGDAQRARTHAHQARALAELADDPRSRCQAHNLLGMLATADGDTDSALVHLRTSRELADRVGDHGLRVAALNNLALAHRARGELDPALELTGAALELCAALGDRHREAALHNNLADLLHTAGRPEEAMANLKAGVAIFAEIGVGNAPRPEVWKLVRW